ncbi:hypothetical protein J6590_079778 [Homalodisca vitripennis]|nr:hypothetical protein J6590_079778 [Homalodisca vitripennis]
MTALWAAKRAERPQSEEARTRAQVNVGRGQRKHHRTVGRCRTCDCTSQRAGIVHPGASGLEVGEILPPSVLTSLSWAVWWAILLHPSITNSWTVTGISTDYRCYRWRNLAARTVPKYYPFNK